MRPRGHLGRILDGLLFAIGQIHHVLHVRNRGDELQIELALEPFAHDVQVQEAEEAATKSEPQRDRGLRLIMEGGVVQLQLLEGVA